MIQRTLLIVCVLASFAWPIQLSTWAATTPAAPDMDAEYEQQFNTLQRDLANRKWFARVARQAAHPAALIDESDRDPADIVLRRTAALLDYLRQLSGAPDLRGETKLLAQLQARGRQIDPKAEAGRKQIYLDTCKLRRRIAFANPRLDFERILFIKRDPATYDHMCDQFYGFNQVPGGALLVINDAFSEQPTLTNLLAGKTVERGRLKGQALTTGSLLSPDLSYDGKTILFAYTQVATKKTRWSPETSYHLFKVNADGTNLVQLTDGSENDFDPCWMPSGRVVFVSERRGGYLRCGARPCPVYTLHTMNPDGSDITCISFHETHEWQPSIDRDGMIVYTRWDYVDRDTNAAHHPWVTTPDGRNPRAVHGNYPDKRQMRPWMEMDIRAIPGSRKYISAAGAHHGQAYGSLVVVDPKQPDDNAMAPLRRITPETPFPEAEGKGRGNWAYATPWPVDEAVCLSAYDPAGKRHGLYLVDHFGNKELLYRDAQMGALSPMPLRARPRPPVIPAASTASESQATVSILNVYESELPWPKDTNIKALRIIQLLPKTTAPNNKPRIGIASQANARAVLGTVPVEADGSAHFTIPARIPVYFQALDEDGLAVQSMRSAAYLQGGEQLTCVGCHEPAKEAPFVPVANTPVALRRKPSRIQPEADGSNPFNYPRLVQPVLDKHCVSCHDTGQTAPDLTGVPGRQHGFTRSYESLAGPYGFFYNSVNGSINDKHPGGGTRTIPGQFGARVSKLLDYIGPGHHDVKMTETERRRITLWLDSNSDFYGAYENTAAQSRGEIVQPSMK